MIRKVFCLLLAMAFVANLAPAEEDLWSLSTDELEKRLEAVDKEIGELELNAEYLKTEAPDRTVSSATIERVGFESETGPTMSKLINPIAQQETSKRLDELYELKRGIEEELNRR